MRRYETIYILRPTLSEDEVSTVIENANAILTTDGGQVISLDKWGLRTLAYLIKKESQGYYIFCDYATSPNNVIEMERKFKIDEAVMKYLTVKVADSITDEGIESARGEYQAAVVAAEEAAKEAEEQSDDKTAAKPDTKETKTDTKETTTDTKETVTKEVAEKVTETKE